MLHMNNLKQTSATQDKENMTIFPENGDVASDDNVALSDLAFSFSSCSFKAKIWIGFVVSFSIRNMYMTYVMKSLIITLQM